MPLHVNPQAIETAKKSAATRLERRGGRFVLFDGLGGSELAAFHIGPDADESLKEALEWCREKGVEPHVPSIAEVAHDHSGHTILEPAGFGWQLRVVGGASSGTILGTFKTVGDGRDFVQKSGIKNCRLSQQETVL